MTRGSLLTQGLEPLTQHSPELRALLERLYTLDDELQAAHVLAKQDDEFGEEVVTRYRRFLAHREELVVALGEREVAVPWQLRMRIDDIELTLRQREEKLSGTLAQAAKTTTATTTTTKTKKAEATSAAGEGDAPLPPASPTERRVVTLLVPSLVALVLALLWFQWFS